MESRPEALEPRQKCWPFLHATGLMSLLLSGLFGGKLTDRQQLGSQSGLLLKGPSAGLLAYSSPKGLKKDNLGLDILTPTATPHAHLKSWPKTSEQSPKGYYFTYH